MTEAAIPAIVEPVGELPFDTTGLLTLYSQQEWEALSARFLGVCKYVDKHPVANLGRNLQFQIDQFVQSFMYFLSQPDYVLPEARRPQFIQYNTVISNLVAISSFKTTDPWLPMISSQHDNLAKLLACYSCRNITRIPAHKFFDISPVAASTWFFSFMQAYHSALADENSYEHLRFHLENPDERLTIVGDVANHIFFGSTYIDARADRTLKTMVNRRVQTLFADSGIVVKNRANPRKIGVVTATWYPQHSVYRNHYDMVAALKDDYEVVLINTGDRNKPLDTSLFSQVMQMQRSENGMSIAAMLENDFGMLYYTDIGMTTESLFLSNARLAPLQITSYGHSVSSFGAEIDYYLASQDVEDLSRLQENYSERVLLLPGLGVTNTKLTFIPTPTPLSDDMIVINCSWFAQKVNIPLLQALQQIVARCPPDRVRFRLFSSHGLKQAGHFLPFARSVHERLQSAVEIMPPLSFERYLDEMSRGHFALEPFPFGGCNTIVDSLHLRQPILCMEGGRWYSRIGSAITRQAGLSELVALDIPSYVDKAVRLVLDAEYRNKIRGKVADLDLETLLYGKEYAQTFKRAVDFLIANHSQLQAEASAEPICLLDRI